MNKAQRTQAIAQQVLGIGKLTGKVEEITEWCGNFDTAYELCVSLNPIPEGLAQEDLEREEKFNIISENMFKKLIIANLKPIMTIDTRPWFDRWVIGKTQEDGTIGNITTLPQDIKKKFITDEMQKIRTIWYNIKQNSENVEQYCLHTIKIGRILEMQDNMIIFHIINGLDDEEAKRKLLQKEFANLDNAITKIVKSVSKIPQVNVVRRKIKCQHCNGFHYPGQCFKKRLNSNQKKHFKNGSKGQRNDNSNNNNNNNNNNDVKVGIERKEREPVNIMKFVD
jgi:hypothetical protein